MFWDLNSSYFNLTIDASLSHLETNLSSALWDPSPGPGLVGSSPFEYLKFQSQPPASPLPPTHQPPIWIFKNSIPPGRPPPAHNRAASTSASNLNILHFKSAASFSNRPPLIASDHFEQAANQQEVGYQLSHWNLFEFILWFNILFHWIQIGFYWPSSQRY